MRELYQKIYNSRFKYVFFNLQIKIEGKNYVDFIWKFPVSICLFPYICMLFD